MPGSNNGWSPGHGCTMVIALLSAECTKGIDDGSLKDKGLFWGDIIFGSCVSVVDAFLLEMQVGHSDRKRKWKWPRINIPKGPKVLCRRAEYPGTCSGMLGA